MGRVQFLANIASLFPWPFRAAISLSRKGVLPSHWLLESLTPKLFARGVLDFINGEPFYVPVTIAGWYRDFEPVTTAVIKRCVQPGMVVVDAGANVGYFSVLADKLGATVHAFEPGTALPILRRNVKLHHCQRVTVHPIALGDKNGTATFFNTEATTLDSMVEPPRGKITGRTIVPQKRLDDVISGRVDLIKIDVQGADIDVLKGATRIIADNPSLKIIAEWSPPDLIASGYKPEDLPAFFRDHGLTNIVALDDYDPREKTVEEMLVGFAADNDGTKYCNLLAQRE